MLEFHLFRLKVHFPSQADAFEEPTPARSRLVWDVVESRPAAELRKGYEWHIGNVRKVDSGAVYFALGRITKTSVPLFDPDRKDFQRVEFDQAPYTHVVADVASEVVAIARNSRLSPSVPGIARQLAKLMRESDPAVKLRCHFEVLPIRDPEDFIEYIRRAWAVTRFKMAFGRPNPIDVEQLFHAPMERLLEESNGDRGATVVRGEALNQDLVEDLARSAAASGTSASASVRPAKGAAVRRRSLSDSSLTFGHEEPLTEPLREALIERMRQLYRRVRGNGGS